MKKELVLLDYREFIPGREGETWRPMELKHAGSLCRRYSRGDGGVMLLTSEWAVPERSPGKSFPFQVFILGMPQKYSIHSSDLFRHLKSSIWRSFSPQ